MGDPRAHLHRPDRVRRRVATFLGVDTDEIAFTRSATESLQCLIAGYNRLKPGDGVLYADLDYPAMQNAMTWLAERRGVKVIRITIPEPASSGTPGAQQATVRAWSRHIPGTAVGATDTP